MKCNSDEPMHLVFLPSSKYIAAVSIMVSSYYCNVLALTPRSLALQAMSQNTCGPSAELLVHFGFVDSVGNHMFEAIDHGAWYGKVSQEVAK